MKQIVKTTAGAMLLWSATLWAGAETVPGILPSGFGAAVDRDVMALREVTKPFHDVDRALAAGYVQTTDCMEKPPEGGMGYHFENDELRDAVLEVTKPEVLVYEKRKDGSFKLNGVEYIVPFKAWTRAEPPRILDQALKRYDRAGFYYLHVWVWEPSPSGLFADWNPRVKCKQPPM